MKNHFSFYLFSALPSRRALGGVKPGANPKPGEHPVTPKWFARNICRIRKTLGPVMIWWRPIKFRFAFCMILAGMCALGGAGCVNYPISRKFREQAKATKDVAFLTIWHNPAAYQGHMVIWGGRILKTVNDTNDEFISVLQAPLDQWERPESTKLSQGRFIIKSSDFLDPAVYRTGAKITIAGELTGLEAQNVGKKRYSFPVVTLRDVYFWRPQFTGTGSSAYMVVPPWTWGGSYQDVYDNYDGGYYSLGFGYPNFDRDWGGSYRHFR